MSTLKILDSIVAELEALKADYERKPDFAKLKEIHFMESKVAQYTERAENKKVTS